MLPLTTILAIDQSTDATGVALLQCDANGCHVAATVTLTATDVTGDNLVARLSRLREMRRGLSEFLGGLEIGIDLIAYEQPFAGPRSANWDAAPMCLGALLTISAVHGLPVVAVMRQAACIQAGCLTLYRESVKNAREREAKRVRLKAAVIDWARRCFDLHLRDTDDAIADAVAVGVAAWEAHKRQEQAAQDKAAQKPLLGRGSRGPRPKKVEALK